MRPVVFFEKVVRCGGSRWEPLFVNRDVCAALGISKHLDAYASLEEYHKGYPVRVDTLGGPQTMATLTEAGLYSLIFRSNKPAARAFEKWVTTEVLPTIRRTGSYRYQRVAPLLELKSPAPSHRSADLSDLSILLRDLLGDLAERVVEWTDIEQAAERLGLFRHRAEVLGRSVTNLRWRSSFSRLLQAYWDEPVSIGNAQAVLHADGRGRHRLYTISRKEVSS